MALAAGSLAGLAVLGACSDAAVSKVAGPTIPEPRFGQLGALAHAVTVCIDPFSSQGTYVFSVGPKASDAANSVYPMFEPIGGIDAVMPGIPQNTVGPWVGDKILGSTSLAAGTVTLGTAGSGFPLCAVVFQRAETEPPPQDPPLLPFFSHPGNRLWHLNADPNNPSAGEVVNPYATVNITPPSGPTYTVLCVNDDTALPQATAGQSNNVCLANGGTIYSSANVFHGSSVTFKMTATTTTTGQIAPTQTTCEDYAKGTSSALSEVFAHLKNRTIHNMSPGVFFYYANVTKGLGESVGTTQSASPNPGGLPNYQVHQGQAYLYRFNGSSCTRVATLPTNNGTVLGGSLLPAGAYVLGIKFNTGAPVGTVVPLATPSLTISGTLLSTHNFQATVGGTPDATTAASIDTKTK